MDAAALELTRRWLSNAARDLKTARIITDNPDGPLDTGIYHCQQAAEKAIKGFLICHDEPFAKTHEIEPLIRKAAEFEPGFLDFVEAAALLSPYAWQFRYPGEMEIQGLSRSEFDEALQHAQAIYDFVLGMLPSETRPE